MGLSPGRLDTLLDAMRGRRVAIIGDAMLDRYLIGDTERISPEAPVPVVTVTERRESLGGAANVAANVASLGGEGRLVAVVGADRDGALLREKLREAALDDRYALEVTDRPTTCKTRVRARGQQVVRIDEEEDGALDPKPLAELTARALAAVADADAVLIADYDKGVMAPELIRAVMAASRARGIPVVVDPKFRSFFSYSGATLFKPNRRELASAIPGIELGSVAELTRAAERLGVEHLLLTLGADGMVLLGRGGGAPHRIASIAREVYDVSGAGDTVTAWAGAVLAAGGSVIEAAEIANVAASVEVAKAGVATVSPEEVRRALCSARDANAGLRPGRPGD